MALASLRTSGGRAKCEINVLTSGGNQPCVEKLQPNLRIHRGTFLRSGNVPFEKTVRYGLGLCRDFKPQVIHGQHFDGVYVATQLRATCPDAVVVGSFHKSASGVCVRGHERSDPRAAAIVSMAPLLDAFVPTCSLYRRELTELGVPPGKIHTILPGLDMHRVVPLAAGNMEPTRLALRGTGFSTESYRFVIVCPARLDPAKDLETFIRAAGRLKRRYDQERLGFVIAGRAADPDDAELGYEADLRAIAARVGVADDLLITGLPLENMYSLYRLGTVCVLPSAREAFGLVLLEALALRVPVVAANIEGILDAIRPDVDALTFEPRDDGGLANQIARLIEERDTAGRLCDMGIQSLKTRFSQSRMGNEHYQLYWKLRNLKKATLALGRG